MPYCNHSGTIERCEFTKECNLCVLHSEYKHEPLYVKGIYDSNRLLNVNNFCRIDELDIIKSIKQLRKDGYETNKMTFFDLYEITKNQFKEKLGE